MVFLVICSVLHSRAFKIISLAVLVLALPLIVIGVGKVVSYLSHAGGTEANLVVDTGVSFKTTDVWRNFAQGGEEKARMLEPIVGKAKALKPQYVRIDHIFDYYDQASLDLTIHDIQAMGAKPFISISDANPPTDWAQWESQVQSLVEHVSGRNGLNISDVYYEVWNEPDLYGGYKMGRDPNYLDLYSHTVAAISRANGVNKFKVGGPAITALYKAWFDGFMQFAARSNLPVDFFSWHRYSKNLEDYEDDVANIKSWLTSYPNYSGIELIITELGPNSENDKVYDNSFGAIHAIATSAVLEGEVTRVFNFELVDGPGESQYWGRWGLFTHPKFGEPIAKPRFSAFPFLNNMVGARVNVSGEGSWVKAFGKKSGELTKLLVVNYDINGTHTEAVPIRFVNLSSGNFTFRRTDFSGEKVDVQVATTSAEWATTQFFKANSAAIFEIIPSK